MQIDALKYELGPENIAAEPPEVRLGRRDLGRMLVVNRSTRRMRHCVVRDLLKVVQKGDVFVVNNSKRIPGVLFGRTSTGAQLELRFAGLTDDRHGLCRIYPRHAISVGKHIELSDKSTLRIERVDIPPHSLCEVSSVEAPIGERLRALGLPITSFFSNGYWKLENYNPVYAEEEGSIESPMAGIHLTLELLESMRDMGIAVATITLHSVGSWLPFLEDDVEAHEMPEESYKIPEDAAHAINRAKRSGGRVFACGSTVLRTLETAATRRGVVVSGSGTTRLYIKPGYEFRIVDAYFTNFHTYRSSLMVLDAAVCRPRLLMRAYEHARRSGYLFHEFGDAVLYV